ncbi:zinc finger protein ZAT12-like [Fagus crenata]|jgi:hypothetical protein|uniref:C2H2-type domain-containing protein n=1 Tax=Fagus sylvatica TaxID=28930 RepID=A0A2N9IK36_FAGSY
MNKRSITQREFDSVSMANCLILLSQGAGEIEAFTNTSPSRVFECKTCNRQFQSFQALGGHRASHKKPRLMGDHGNLDSQSHGSPTKPKSHECSVCGLEFAIGQALGGHMRRHRTALNENQSTLNLTGNMHMEAPRPSLSFTSSQLVVNKSNSRKALYLDLNLTPFENDLEFLKLRKATPMVGCFL